MNILSKLYYSLRLRSAVQMADKAHAESGKRFYVLPSYQKGCKLVVMDRAGFRLLKKKGLVNRNADMYTVSLECFYATPNPDGSDFMGSVVREAKKEQYFQWVVAKKKADKKLSKAMQKKDGKVR
jgi:hypothetical protein